MHNTENTEMEYNIAHTLDRGKRVSSSYAEIYFPDDPESQNPSTSSLTEEQTAKKNVSTKLSSKAKITNDDAPSDLWTSPSDLLIGHIELIPPFTSKITRGITHKGILGIGDKMLQSEQDKFMKHLTQLLSENDSAWSQILQHEKESVINKVRNIYDNIFITKSKIMQQEINEFYEQTLLEVEKDMKSQVNDVLISAHANIISDLNTEIKLKLAKEKIIFKKVLKERYESEVVKIKDYYRLLLRNEIYRNKKLVHQAIIERNDALKAFYRQIEAENITSTMYVLCLERKKCKIKRFLLENYQGAEIAEKYKKIKECENLIADYQSKDENLSKISNHWKENILKVLKIFIKFISFSLQLLPEQSGFLLDLEKMVVLQLNEIEKAPMIVTPILCDGEKFQNIFKFEEFEKEVKVCDKEPFVVVGDLSPDVPPVYGSRETLPSDVDLPYVRVQRQYVYVKCHDYEEIKTLLEAGKCTCRLPQKEPSQSPVSSTSIVVEKTEVLTKKESSNELLVIDDFHRLQECPHRHCQDWAKQSSFPYLDSYLDFNEENYARVKTILGQAPERDPIPELLDPKLIVMSELQFAATKEPFHTVETQYSSQEDINVPDIECRCVEGYIPPHPIESVHKPIDLNEILSKRKTSLQRIIDQNPTLLKMFTDESFDFVM